ncbi:MAG: SH3 domain-containing protein [Thermomicrobiales bacterium]|nr:SH3 domain-containing protein [Thermomicrobiales bacterium]
MNSNNDTHRFSRRSAIMAFTASSGLLLTRNVFGQEASTPEAGTPVATAEASPVAATDPEIRNLMDFQIDELPESPFTVRLLRIMLEPGAITPMHRHHGPEIDMVEIGEVLIRSLGDAPVTRADGTQETSTGDDVVLGVDDAVFFPAGIGMYFENTTDSTVVILSSVIIPVGPDFINERIMWVDEQPDLTGVSYQKLADGLIQTLPVQAAGWTVDEVTLPAALDLPGIDGIGTITPLKGNLSFTIDSGQVQVTRAQNTGLQPNAVPGTSFSLGDADGAFFPNGFVSTSRAEESDVLTYLAMNISPVNGTGATAAAITFTAGDGTVAGATADITIGSTVTTTENNVNMRAEASVDAEIVEQIASGVNLEVLDGPVDGDDYTWFKVRVLSAGSAEGWVVTDFIEPSSAPTENEGDGTSSESSDAFPVGSKVVTTDNNVRIRSEASTEGEALTALPEGTELIVTGAVVAGGEYSWLPVEAEDGTEGYVVTDFVEAVP